MQRQFILAIVLSFVVIYGWQAMFPPPKKTPPVQQAAQQVTKDPSGAQAPGAQQALAADAAADANAKVEAAPLVAASAEQDVTVENAFVKAVFNTRGGVLKSWRLKNYRDGEGAPLELIPQNVPNPARPFTVDVDDATTSATLRNALFKPDAQSLTIGSEAKTLVFEYRDAAGLVARKEFTFNPTHPYIVRFLATVTKNDTPLNHTINWGPALGTGVVAGGMSYAPAPQPIFYRDRKVSRVAIGDIEKHRQEQGSFGFLGVDDHYFLSAMLPPTEQLQVNYSPELVTVPGQSNTLQFISWSVKSPSGPQPAADFFFGPKDLDVLQSIKPDLVRAIDFGMFDWLVVPLLRALKWIDSYIGNYGWSIIALTVIINLVMFPLKHKSIVSMRKMQELQPQMKAIQDRYAKLKMTDPGRQKMNEEVMALYKQHGTNPASGCVPMLLTLPGARRVLRDACRGDRAPRRAVPWLDQGFVSARSLLRDTSADGYHDVRAAEDVAVGGRSGTGQDDDVHAADVHGHVDLGAERPGAVLDGEQPVGNRPADADQPPDWSAAAAQRASAG